MKKKDIQEILKNHKNEIAKKFGIKEIGIFGSYVRGEETETSDIDIIIEFEEGIYCSHKTVDKKKV